MDESGINKIKKKILPPTVAPTIDIAKSRGISNLCGYKVSGASSARALYGKIAAEEVAISNVIPKLDVNLCSTSQSTFKNNLTVTRSSSFILTRW